MLYVKPLMNERTVRLEPVERQRLKRANSAFCTFYPAQSFALSALPRLCPSTGTGRTVLSPELDENIQSQAQRVLQDLYEHDRIQVFL